MKLRLHLLIALVAVFASASTADAQLPWLRSFAHSVVVDFHRNNCWPEPFMQADREATRIPFNAMVANGWRLQNALTDHHFEPTTGRLNEAGKLKAYRILTEVPKQHRTIYVLRAKSAEETAARLDGVEKLVATYAAEGIQGNVVLSTVTPRGWPAERVDAVTRAFQASAPEPRLSAATTEDDQ